MFVKLNLSSHIREMRFLSLKDSAAGFTASISIQLKNSKRSNSATDKNHYFKEF